MDPSDSLPVHVVLLPRDLAAECPDLSRRVVIVLDVLRATTTIAAALDAGIEEIRTFESVEAAAAAAAAFDGKKILAGERGCARVPGFDLGNSPRQFDRELHAGSTLFHTTTNGTRTLRAVRGAVAVFAGALVNCSATALAAARISGCDGFVLVCAGTDGQVSAEDCLGAGAIADELIRCYGCVPHGDGALMALGLWGAYQSNPLALIRQSQGAKNVVEADLVEDIPFCARVNLIDQAAKVDSNGVIRSFG